MSARVVLVVLGVLVIMGGFLLRAVDLEGAEYTGERATNPDGTVTYFEPDEDGTLFTGTPAEADAWAEAERQERRSSASQLPTLWIVGGAASIVVGLWPGGPRSHDAPTPESLSA